MSERVLAIGVDGASGGWVRAVATGEPDAPQVSLSLTQDLDDAVAGGGDGAPACVDVPMGLPRADEVRACDAEARRALPSRGSTVFSAPPRFVLAASSYAKARDLVAEERARRPGTRGVSAQAFALVPKIREADKLMAHHDHPGWLREAHPEVSFVEMARDLGRDPRIAGKRTARGMARRLALLDEVFGEVPALLDVPGLDDARDATDALDALACLWTALRVRARREVVLGDGAEDESGVAMRIAA